MALNEELINIALEALAKHNTKISSIDGNIKTLKAEVKDTIQKSMLAISSNDKGIQDVKDNLTNLVQQEMSKIPIPKDGLHGIDGKDGLTGLDGQPGVQGKSIQGNQGLQGKQGPIGLPGKVGLDGKSIKGKDGFTPVKGVDYTDGKDGLSIIDITSTQTHMNVIFSDGTTKNIKLPKLRTTSGGGPASMGSVTSSIVNSTDTNTYDAINSDVLTYKDGFWVAEAPKVTTGSVDLAFQNRVELESMFKFLSNTAFKELTYINGDITNVDIYTDSNKGTKLLSKIIGYNNDNITSVSITDEINGGTLVKTIVYAGLDITSITSTYTP